MKSSDSVLVDEVRKRRHEISQQFDHDPWKYFEHLKTIQAQYADRLVNQITIVRRPDPDGGGPSK